MPRICKKPDCERKKLDTVKERLGRSWTSFVRPDEKLLKARGDMNDCADVKVSEVVTFILWHEL